MTSCAIPPQLFYKLREIFLLHIHSLFSKYNYRMPSALYIKENIGQCTLQKRHTDTGCFAASYIHTLLAVVFDSVLVTGRFQGNRSVPVW